jgi:hypothetical protein
MRKILLTAVTVFAFTAMASAQSQVVKTNPLGLAFGNFNVTYETVLNSSSSLNLSANYRYRLLGVDVSSFGAGVGWRYFFTHAKKPVPAGFYVMPQAIINFGSVDDFNYTALGFGAEIGYQWVWDSGFVLDLGLGPMYRILSGEYEDIGFDGGSGVWPSATLAVGYAF